MKTIVFGVTGGIGAYAAFNLIDTIDKMEHFCNNHNSLVKIILQ